MDEELMNTEVDTEITSNDVETSSVENGEVAESQGADNSNAEVNTDATNEEKPIDVNAIAAAARRKAEQEAKNAQKAIDDEYVRRFGSLSNPITGEPIRSQADYLKALDAQEELRAKNELMDKGIDPSLIDKLIANNPMIREAQQVMADAQRRQTIDAINADVAELGTLDPSIKSLDNVPPNVIEMSMASNGSISLVNAYKILNYGKLSESKEAAITQNAINQAKSKAHLNPVNGVATPDEGVEIPSELLGMWKEQFPNKTSAELKALYNKTL